MKIGYIRCSSEHQNTARQEVLMQELGVDEVFIDKLSGKNTDRPQLKKMLAYVRKGDTVIVSEISRFARNTKDLLELVEQLSLKRVEFISKKESIDTTTPAGKFMLTIFGAVACYLLIPVGCGALLTNCFFPRAFLQSVGTKLVAFGAALLLVIPSSVWWK